MGSNWTTQHGEWLKKQLKERRLNVREAAKMCGVARVTLHRWLSGQQNPLHKIGGAE